MPKQVKKAKEGKIKMSEEEKALYLQAQEEMDRRKQKAVEQFLKDKLQEDQRGTEQLLWRLDEGWRMLFRFCKTQEQRNNIEVFKRTWERQLDHIDSCIKDMSDELREKECLSAQMHCSHLLHISQIKELHKKRMDILQQEWESSIDKIMKCYNFQSIKEAVKLSRSLPDFRVRMSSEDMLQSLTLVDTDPSDQDKYEDLLRETESLLNKMYFQEKVNTGQLKERQQILEQGEQKLKDLTSKNQCSREALVRAAKELQKVQKKKLTELQSKHASDEISEAELREQLVGAEKQNQKLRAKVKRSSTRARKSLIELTIQSDKAAKNLKSVIAQGERVLRMHKLCKKMEDRLLMTEKIHKVLVENLNTEDTVEQAQKCEFPELRLLTHQHNVAIELCNALRQQRNVLHHQNKQLRRQNEDMRQHLLI